MATHFHLLRADFLGPLRDGLRAVSNGESSRDVDVYRTCALRGIIQRRGLLHRFECAGDREPWAKASWAKASEGQRKGRLMNGALVIIVDPSTLGEQTWVCAVVRSRELRKDKSLIIDLWNGGLRFRSNANSKYSEAGYPSDAKGLQDRSREFRGRVPFSGNGAGTAFSGAEVQADPYRES